MQAAPLDLLFRESRADTYGAFKSCRIDRIYELYRLNMNATTKSLYFGKLDMFFKPRLLS